MRPNLDGISFPMVSVDSSWWLEREFEEEKVTQALKDFDGDKALGLDVLSFLFH